VAISDIPSYIPKGSSVSFHWLVQNCPDIGAMTLTEASRVLSMLVSEGLLYHNHGYYRRVEE
jgi:hypothetical protein